MFLVLFLMLSKECWNLGSSGIRPVPNEILYGKVGSNFTMPGLEQDQHDGVIEWEFSSVEKPLAYIATYYFDSHIGPDVFSAYNKRISFFESNGSFVLHQLQKSDEGIYYRKINLTKKWIIDLKVYEPVSNVLVYPVPGENSSILLHCNFSGDGDFIYWSRDGKSVPDGWKLMNRNQTLQVPSTEACSLFRCEIFSAYEKKSNDFIYKNEHCKDWTSIKIAAISSVAGLIIIIIIIIIILLVIYFCCKRRKSSHNKLPEVQKLRSDGNPSPQERSQCLLVSAQAAGSHSEKV
uniref:Uncharacterized protein LOC117364691 isoform X2 n=1 Tax=Geotrypetes seraphini TaxID=260995 RepID=A0A6P8RWF6_GEOSA|nr:uncharacterized protein LOC117364691 isoform X2 [Geotrypetes seraphini]